MGDLLDYFQNNRGRLINKWLHYFEVYERHLERFRNREITMLEIGIAHGGSLQMWKHYFGPKAKIYAIDITPACKNLEEDQVTILIGDQGDPQFLKQVVATMPKVDILIDDGSHIQKHQILTLQALYPHIKDDGVYICEDLHCSYWKDWGGGYLKPDTFIEYSKKLIDHLNSWHSQNPALPVSPFTKSAHSMHFYDSMLVIEKRVMTKPQNLRIGKPTW